VAVPDVHTLEAPAVDTQEAAEDTQEAAADDTQKDAQHVVDVESQEGAVDSQQAASAGSQEAADVGTQQASLDVVAVAAQEAAQKADAVEPQVAQAGKARQLERKSSFTDLLALPSASVSACLPTWFHTVGCEEETIHKFSARDVLSIFL
jgi:DNA gyrase/topoisomerase IV subunit B